MNIFGQMMGSFINKEKATIETIQSAMADVAEEYNLTHTDFAFFIQPKTKEFDFKVYITKLENGKPTGIIREITVKEIVGEDDSDEGEETDE
jgi:hypothetical protein